MSTAGERLVLVGGHESGGGRHLERYLLHFDDAIAVPAGRRLADAVTSGLGSGQSVCVVPMTFGRDPVMLADAARSLRWVARGRDGELALAQPFADTKFLIAVLRAAAGIAHRRAPGAALVLAAGAADPFDDAELHRVAHLVRTHGVTAEVVAARLDDDAALTDTMRRLRRLGYERSIVIPADFRDALDLEPEDGHIGGVAVSHYGPTLSDSAVLRIVRERVVEARAALARGDDGISAALRSDHSHGYAHSHSHHQHDHHDHHRDAHAEVDHDGSAALPSFR